MNEAPITVTDSITVIEAGTATTTSAGSSNVLSNDNDPDGDNIIAQVVSSPNNSSVFHYKILEHLLTFMTDLKQQLILLLTELSMELILEIPSQLRFKLPPLMIVQRLQIQLQI